ncbi:TetR/AcrR family transcriptional regulator [Gordonia sp. VNK21]|uniref:TetR/AcrR family transcriptional regulator n=1 Tax=Gordonia sp. VNK21 TaxID=3382483 RepID=UPI0038D41F99
MSIESPAGSAVVDRLVEVTAALLAEKGIRGTAMAQVAERAGISRAWLYRHFPDKNSLIGAAIVRLADTFSAEAQDELSALDGFAEQVVAGVRIGRGAYDDPGTLLMRLQREEPEAYAACAGAGVNGLVPDLAAFWRPYVAAAVERGEIDGGHDLDEVSEWLARMLISMGTMPGRTLDPEDPESLARHVRRYLLPALSAPPAG